MNGVSWIKLKLSMFDDEKIRIIESMDGGDAKLIIWIKLLTMAGKSNMKGYLMIAENIPYTPDMIATVINRKPAEVKMALEVFRKFGMIDMENSIISIVNWEKHQNELSLDSVREKTRERVKKHREDKRGMLVKALENNSNQVPTKIVKDDCNVTCNVTCNDDVTLPSFENKELENKDITVTKVTVQQKKVATALHNHVKDQFKNKYLELFEADYYWTAKDAAACNQFIKKVKNVVRSRSPDPSDQQLGDAITYILEGITDKWLLEHFSLTNINSQFNEIIAQIKAKKQSSSSISKIDQVFKQIEETWNSSK